MAPTLEQLQAFLKTRPDDPFLKYAIAIELKNLGQTQQAEAAFAALATEHPQYVPTYYHWGQTLELLGRPEDGVATYERGIGIARQAGDSHAAEEMQRALMLLKDLL
ncbi:MAG: tetratricopeptide repeat protein [Deltaproteobacteria bacterium]|nr:tetratricopeptide repeat protein [Deltaproteobacteria bacterium]